MGSAGVDFVRSCTTVIIIGIVLTFVALAYLCWLLFAVAVYALPFFAGVTSGLATYHSGSGPIGAIIVGAIASSITLIVGQIAFTTLRPPLIRGAIARLHWMRHDLPAGAVLPGPEMVRPPICTPGFLFLRPTRVASCVGHSISATSPQCCGPGEPGGL